jgi:proteic killer suppression protein
VIRSFRNKGLQRFAETGDGSRLRVQNEKRIRQILLALDAATMPQALNIPGLKFHALKGSMKGRYAVWVSGNYRITFEFDGEDAVNVDLEDYH